ncbi:MAG: DNA internalization-related competence protein ComEC/Rec2 [Acidobacteria bacterium]|nr:DNA internalization-related competence protein ComEC/Rec2 [Acidobacteriota bacterium]
MGKTVPALGPALFLLCGAWFAASSPIVAATAVVPLAALLVGVGWTWRRVPGRLVAWTAVGALLVWVRPELLEGCLERLDQSRPVTLIGATASAWKSTEFGWKSALSVHRIRQGTTVVRCHARVALTAAREAPPESASSVRVKGFLKRYEPLRNGTLRHPQRPSRGVPWRMHVKSPRFWTVTSSPIRSSAKWSPRAPPREDESGLLGPPSQVGRPPSQVSPLSLLNQLTRLGRRFRESVEESFAGVETRPGVRAARALVLGDRAALDPGFKRSLRRFGLSHLFAVSGLHVALVSLLVHWLLRGLRHRPRLVFTTVAVIAYLVLVGARPSIIRATAMSLLAFGAVCSQRPPHSQQALCLAACALVVVDPALVLNLGYQLTVSATAGILWLSPVLADRWGSLPRILRRPLAATVGAQLASLPWTASTFSLVHPLAPLLNLVAIPWMAAFALCSFVASALMKVVPESHGWVAAALDAGVMPVAWLSRLPPNRWFMLPVALSFGEGCLLAGSLVALLLLRSVVQRMIFLSVALVLLHGPSMSDVAEVIAIDVGQGDAILLHDGASAVLIDGGGWRRGDIGAAVLIPTLARLGIRRLSAAVVTHPDIDHCRGLVDLSYYLPIARIWSTSGASRSPCVRELVSRPRTRWRQLWRGQSVQVGRMTLEVLHPGAGSTDRGNDSSLVLRAVLDRRSVLLTGDIEARAENSILRRYPPEKLRSQVLKLAHHGSKTSTTDRFLEAVSPRIAVVSAGRKNLYGHPASLVLERCRRHRVAVARTDRDGLIRLPLEPHGRRQRR